LIDRVHDLDRAREKGHDLGRGTLELMLNERTQIAVDEHVEIARVSRLGVDQRLQRIEFEQLQLGVILPRHQRHASGHSIVEVELALLCRKLRDRGSSHAIGAAIERARRRRRAQCCIHDAIIVVDVATAAAAAAGSTAAASR